MDLEAEDGVAYELDDDGRLVERNLGMLSAVIAAQIACELSAQTGRAGYVLGGGAGLQIFPQRPRRIARADVVYISRTRLHRLEEAHLEVAPELVAEVLTPWDFSEHIEAKVRAYLSAGVVRVWIVYPEARCVHVRRPDGSGTILGENDEISGEEAAPGFSAPVSSFFPE